MAEFLVAMAIMLGVYCFGLVASVLSARRWFAARRLFSAFGGNVDRGDKVAVAVGIVAWPCVLMCGAMLVPVYCVMYLLPEHNRE